MNLRTIALPLAAMLSAGVIAACGDDETTSQTSDASSATTETTTAAPTPTKTSTAPTKTSEDNGGLAIRLKDGKPAGAIKSLTVKKGEKVRFTVTSDTTQEIHAHAYDIFQEAGPGKPATFDFPASIEGIFEVEVEGTGEQILKLTVNP